MTTVTQTRLGARWPIGSAPEYHERADDELDLDNDGRPAWVRVGAGWELQWRRARFVVGADGTSVVASIGRGVDDELADHLVADHLVPRLLALHGHSVLHGTAVGINGRAIAFVGDSGAGKSTLALSLALEHGSLLADDCLVIDTAASTPVVVPTASTGRLRADTLAPLRLDVRPSRSTGKASVVCRTTKEALALSALLVLERTGEADAIELRPIRPAVAMVTLARHRFAPAIDASAITDLRSLVERVPVLTLRYPSDFERLPNLHDSIHDLLRQIAPPLPEARR
jgi:hypothetical protein